MVFDVLAAGFEDFDGTGGNADGGNDMIEPLVGGKEIGHRIFITGIDDFPGGLFLQPFQPAFQRGSSAGDDGDVGPSLTKDRGQREADARTAAENGNALVGENGREKRIHLAAVSGAAETRSPSRNMALGLRMTGVAVDRRLETTSTSRPKLRPGRTSKKRTLLSSAAATKFFPRG